LLFLIPDRSARRVEHDSGVSLRSYLPNWEAQTPDTFSCQMFYIPAVSCRHAAWKPA